MAGGWATVAERGAVDLPRAGNGEAVPEKRWRKE
jgi:hypothetical protein